MTEPRCVGFIIDFYMPFIHNCGGQLVHYMAKWDVGLCIDFHNTFIHAEYWATLMFTILNVMESGAVAPFA